MRYRIAAIVVVMALAAGAPAQTIHKWVDANGRVQYTQQPPPDGVESEIKGSQKEIATPERVLYCEHVQDMAFNVASMKAQGMPLTAASAALLARRAGGDLSMDRPAIEALTSFVYSAAHPGSLHADVSRAAYESCLGGAFGKPKNPGPALAPGPDASPAEAKTKMGTGWITAGVIVTNYHVIHGSSRLRVRFQDGSEVEAKIRQADRTNDLVALTVTKDLPVGLPIAYAEAGIGAEVFTIGYPHIDIMGSNAKLTTGIVNSTTGLGDDPRLYQISVPVQAGNSGGPLINMRGEVVGVVTAKLSAAKVFQWTGDLPQNVNYAVKSKFARELLPEQADSVTMMVRAAPLEHLAKRVGTAVVMVIAE